MCVHHKTQHKATAGNIFCINLYNVHDRQLTWSRTSSLLVKTIIMTPSSGLMPVGMLLKHENHIYVKVVYVESLTYSIIALIKVDLSWHSTLSALNILLTPFCL